MRVLCVALAFLACACVQLRFARKNRDEPIPESMTGSLEPGTADLELCLARLGAPHYVWEYKESGIAIAYVWSDEASWALTMSYTPFKLGPAFTLSYDRLARSSPGVVLLFDAERKLLSVRRGLLHSIIAEEAQGQQIPGRSRRPSRGSLAPRPMD